MVCEGPFWKKTPAATSLVGYVAREVRELYLRLRVSMVGGACPGEFMRLSVQRGQVVVGAARGVSLCVVQTVLAAVSSRGRLVRSPGSRPPLVGPGRARSVRRRPRGLPRGVWLPVGARRRRSRLDLGEGGVRTDFGVVVHVEVGVEPLSVVGVEGGRLEADVAGGRREVDGEDDVVDVGRRQRAAAAAAVRPIAVLGDRQRSAAALPTTTTASIHSHPLTQHRRKRKANSHRHDRHDTDWTVFVACGVAVRIESARQVRSVSGLCRSVSGGAERT